MNDPHARAGDKAASMTRLQESVSTLNVAAAQQDNNFATKLIFLCRIPDSHYKQASAARVQQCARLSTYEQLEAWRIDQGEKVTPTRSTYFCPKKGQAFQTLDPTGQQKPARMLGFFAHAHPPSFMRGTYSTILASTLDALVGADARPHTLLTLAPATVMLAKARSAALLAPPLLELVVADN